MPGNHDLLATLHAVEQSPERVFRLESANFQRSHLHREAIYNTGIKYGKIIHMGTARKITVEIPAELLEKAQRASGTGITQTVRTGLQLLAASDVYDRLLQMRGKVRFTRTFEELKEDR